MLCRCPAYGYALKTLIEERTGGTWPLNIGPVYTTRGRLERDGLVEPAGQSKAGHALYALTVAGEQEVAAWLLVLDRLVFDVEAEPRWLEHCESRVVRLAAEAADPCDHSPPRPGRRCVR